MLLLSVNWIWFFLLVLWLQLISNLISPCSNMDMAKLSQYHLYIICISFEIQFDFEKIMWHEAYSTHFASAMQWDLCQNNFNGKITEMEQFLELSYDKALQFTQMQLRMLLILCVHFIMFVVVLNSHCFLFQPIKN